MRKWLAQSLLLVLFLAGIGLAPAAGAAPRESDLPSTTAALPQNSSTWGTLVFLAVGPVDLLVTAPAGERAGMDPDTKQVLQEIPAATYYAPQETFEGMEFEIVSIPDPVTGTYAVRVTGTGGGWFDLLAMVSSPGTGEKEVLLHTVGAISTSMVVEYAVPGRPLPLQARPVVYALPVMKEIGEWSTVLRVLNPGMALAHAKTTVYDDRGNTKLYATDELALPPHSAWPISTTDRPSLPDGFWGVATAERREDQGTLLALTAETAGGRLMATEGLAHGASNLYIPYLPNGDLLGVLYAMNASDEEATVRVNCYDLNGTLVPSASVTLTVSPRATLRSTLQSGLPAGFQGSAVLESLAGQPLVGAVFLGDLVGKAALYSVPDRPSAALFVPQALKGNAGLNTTLRVQNTAATATTIVVRYYDAAGQPLVAAETRLGLPPHGAAPVALADNPALPAGFSGAAIIQSMDGAPLTAVALVQGGPGSDTLGATGALYGGSPLLALPYIDTVGQTPAVQVQNLGSAPTAVTLRCFDEAGAPAYTAAAAVAPYGYAAFVTATLPLAPGVYSAVLESSNSQPLAAFARQQGITEGLSLYGGSAAGPFVVPPLSFVTAPAATRAAPFSVTLVTNAPPAEVVSTTLWVRTPLTTTWVNSGLVLTIPSGTFVYAPTAGDGTYYFAAVAADRAGRREAEPAGTGDSQTLYDTTPPSSQVGALPIYSPGTFTVTWSGSDALSGVATYDVQYSQAADGPWSDWLTGTAQTQEAFGPGENGTTYYFRCRAHDNVGNVEAWPANPTYDATTTVDRVAPTSQVAALPSYQTTATFDVAWSGDDALSGVATYDVQYATAPSGPWSAWLTGTVARQAEFTLGQDGVTYYFRSRAHDLAGNVEDWPTDPAYDTFTAVDLTPPSSQVAALPAYSMGTFTVTWSGSDATSGIAKYDVRYRIDNNDWQGWLQGVSQTQALFQADQEGHTYYFVCRASDNADNVEDWPQNPNYDASTIVDLTPPASSATAPDYDTGGSVSVSWTASDVLAGMAETELWVRTPLTTTWMASGLVLTGTSGVFAYTPMAGDGTYYFAARAQDNAGNWEAVPGGAGDDSTVYDTTPPTSQVTALPAYSLATFTVNWSGSDALSGLLDYDVQVCSVDCISGWSDWLVHTTATAHAFTGSNGVTYSFRSRARDRAGNVEPWPASADTATTVDTQPPETAVTAMLVYTTSLSFPVHWQGSDALSGLHHYNIYYRPESAAGWTLWLSNVTYTQTTFSGARGYTYHFCSQGVDNLGNAEACPPSATGWPIQSDAHIGVTPWSRVNDLPAVTGSRTVHVTWSGAPGTGIVYDVQVRDGFYGAWQNWKSSFGYTYADYTGQYGHIYCFRSRQRAGGIWELYPFNYDTYTKLVEPSGLGGPLPPGSPLAIPPDEAPDRMAEVTRTQSINTLLTGYIAPADDVDWYRFELTATTRVRVRLYDLPADFDVYVFDGSGQFLWASTWGRRLPEEVVVRVPAGVYYVQLVGYAGAWSGETLYQLSVEVVKSSGQGGPPGAEGAPGSAPVPW